MQFIIYYSSIQSYSHTIIDSPAASPEPKPDRPTEARRQKSTSGLGAYRYHHLIHNLT